VPKPQLAQVLDHGSGAPSEDRNLKMAKKNTKQVDSSDFLDFRNTKRWTNNQQ
jgi:hypothetical protein